MRRGRYSSYRPPDRTTKLKAKDDEEGPGLACSLEKSLGVISDDHPNIRLTTGLDITERDSSQGFQPLALIPAVGQASRWFQIIEHTKWDDVQKWTNI